MEQKQNEIPMIPKHQHQAEMMHMSWTIRWLIIGIIVGFMCMLIQAYVFVTSYTSRTERWLTTYNELVSHMNVTEETNEKEPAGNIQQLQIP